MDEGEYESYEPNQQQVPSTLQQTLPEANEQQQFSYGRPSVESQNNQFQSGGFQVKQSLQAEFDLNQSIPNTGLGFETENLEGMTGSGMFSYRDDDRRRESLRSQSDTQLEDISGNVVMSDRHIQEVQFNKQPGQPVDNTQNPLIQNQTVTQQAQDVEHNVQKNIEQISQKQNQQQKTQNTQAKQKETQQYSQAQLIQQKKPQPASESQQQNMKNYTPAEQQGQKIVPSLSMVKQSFILLNTPPKKEQKKQETLVIPPLVIGSPQPINNNNISSSPITYSNQKNSSPSSGGKFSSDKKYVLENQKATGEIQFEKQRQKYRLELQNDMLDLSKSMKNNQKNQSKTQKNRFYALTDRQSKANKTHIPLMGRFYNNPNTSTKKSQQINSEELRMLLKISFEKKKQNYEMLKVWDKERAQNMSLHRNMIEMLQNQVDIRIKASLENFQIYSSFFRQKLKQQQKFLNSPVINTKYALQNNAISKNIYINCSVILNSLSEQNQHKNKKIQGFISLIKNNIIKNLIEKHMNQSQRELFKIREKISTLKNSLKKYNTETEEKSQALAFLFNESANNVLIKSQKDFYSAQLEFLRSASQQVLIQKRLGETCLEYYHTAFQEQQKRSFIIKEAIKNYSKGLKQTYNVQLDDAQFQQLSKDEQYKLIDEFYSLEDMFDERNRKFFKEKFQLNEDQDIQIGDLNQYIQEFHFDNFNSRMLLLKEFRAKYSALNAKEVKGPRQQTCYMVITVDFYIHLFFSYEKSADSLSHKPDVSLKINPKQLQIRQQKEELLDIVKKDQKRSSMISYFWQNKNQKVYRMKFSTKDSKEQFCDYVQKLMF